MSKATSSRRVRLAVDVSSLAGGSDRRGIGRYLRGALQALAERDDLEITAYGATGVALPAGVESSSASVRRSWRDGPTDRLAYAAARDGADVFWSPAQFPPTRYDGPWVQTLLDLIPLAFGSRLLRHEVKHWRRAAPALRRADAVICPSRSSAQQGVDYLDLDPNRIHVVPLGVDASFRPQTVPAADPPYLLLVSAWGPHKGFGEAMAVVADLADRGYPHRLKLVGPNDAWMRKQIEAIRVSSRHPDRVDVAGYVDDLAATYAGASVLICSSRMEGFGLPVAEAMSCGVPVVSFDNSSLPEVVGDGGVLVADGDVTAMASAVAALLDDPGYADRVRAAALVRANGFSWENAATSMADVFRTVAAGSVTESRAPRNG